MAISLFQLTPIGNKHLPAAIRATDRILAR
jgi:hypothetical protein